MQTTTSVGHVIAGIVVTTIKWLGKPLVATATFAVLLAATWNGHLSPAAGVVLTGVEGVILGFGLALRFLDYAMTYEPAVFVNQYNEWKRDGRWDELVSSIRSKRAVRGN